MEIYTVDRNFEKVDTIEKYGSAIWTERYYGDSDFEIVVEPSKEMVKTFKPSTFVMEADSPEPMIVETLDIEAGQLKVTGISLTQWLVNRFIRSSPLPADRFWNVGPIKPGVLMGQIVQNWCVDSPYLDNSTTYNQPGDTGHSWPSGWALNPDSMGIVHQYLDRLKIPSLLVGSTYAGGNDITTQIPFGPVYDALKNLAQAYEIGQRIILYAQVVGEYHILWYTTYVGLDRTSSQSVNPLVRFSPDLDTLTNVKELQSMSQVIGVIFTYAPLINPYEQNYYGTPYTENGFTPFSYSGNTHGSGWDLRAYMNYDEDLKPADIGGKPADQAPSSGWDYTALFTAANNLNSLEFPKQRAILALPQNRGASIVDGEIVPTNQFKYGVDYNLGDIIEIEGYSGTLQNARVTEYIRAKDNAGYREYPTVAIIQ